MYAYSSLQSAYDPMSVKLSQLALGPGNQTSLPFPPKKNRAEARESCGMPCRHSIINELCKTATNHNVVWCGVCMLCSGTRGLWEGRKASGKPEVDAVAGRPLSLSRMMLAPGAGVGSHLGWNCASCM